ncbi:MAG: hypothetical protein ABIJ12_09785, partial [bacterium]
EIEFTTNSDDISADPIYNDPENGDYRLSLYSPCVNAGNPDSIYNDPDATRNDLGAFPTTYCCVLRGDMALPNDGIVQTDDLVYLVDYLFKMGNPQGCPIHGDCAPPLDGKIFVNDIVYLVNYLFKGGPAPPEC